MTAGGFIKLAILISATMRGGKAFMNATGLINKMKAALAAVAAEMILLATIMAIDFAKAAVTAFASFDTGMAKVLAITQATTEEFRALTDAAREMAKVTIFTANQVADAMFYLSQAGLSASEVLGAVPHTLNLAMIGMLELGRASDIVTDIMRALKIETADLGRVTDILVETYSSYNTSIEQLGTAFSYVAPIARLLGEDINVLSTAIGILSSAGIKGERAGTALRNIMTKLINPSMEAQRTIDALGVSVFDAQGNFRGLVDLLQQFRDAGANATQVMQVFQMRAGPAFLALMDAIEGGDRALIEFSEHLASAETAGAAQRAADIIEASAESRFKIFKSKITDIMIGLGAELMPVAEQLMELLFPKEGKSELMESLMDLFTQLVPVFVAMIPFLVITIQLLASIVNLVSSVMPLVLVLVGAFMLVLSAATAVVNVIAEVVHGLTAAIHLMDGVGKLGGMFGDAVGWLGEGRGNVRDFFGDSRAIGGTIPKTGYYRMHKDEVVFNPALGHTTPMGVGRGNMKSQQGQGKGLTVHNHMYMQHADALAMDRETRKYIRMQRYM